MSGIFIVKIYTKTCGHGESFPMSRPSVGSLAFQRKMAFPSANFECLVLSITCWQMWSSAPGLGWRVQERRKFRQLFCDQVLWFPLVL